MKHARDDYNRIQDPSGKIPEDEPVFLLRAQDKHAAATLVYYASLCLKDHETHDGLRVANVTLAHALEMNAWPKKKAPDLLPST